MFNTRTQHFPARSSVAFTQENTIRGEVLISACYVIPRENAKRKNISEDKLQTLIWISVDMNTSGDICLTSQPQCPL